MTGDRKVGVAVWAAGVLAMGAGQAFAAAEGDQSPSIFSGDLGNIIWTLITFIAVLFVLGKFAWGPILAALQKREEFIRNSLAEAKKDREDAQAELRKIEERLASARDEAGAIIEQGRRGGEEVKRAAQQEARQEAEAMIRIA